MTEADLEWLTDMLEKARLAVSILGRKTIAEVDADVRTFYAISYAVQIVGEAANHVTAEGRREFPDVPWSKVIGMRHRLVHAYDASRTDILVETIREHFPALIDVLERAHVEDDIA